MHTITQWNEYRNIWKDYFNELMIITMINIMPINIIRHNICSSIQQRYWTCIQWLHVQRGCSMGHRNSSLQERSRYKGRHGCKHDIPTASVLHNVAVTVRAIRRVVQDGQRARFGLRLSRSAQSYAPVRHHAMTSHRDARPVRLRRRQLLRLRGLCSSRRHLRRCGRRRHHWPWSARLPRSARSGARSYRPRVARPGVILTWLCRSISLITDRDKLKRAHTNMGYMGDAADKSYKFKMFCTRRVTRTRTITNDDDKT